MVKKLLKKKLKIVSLKKLKTVKRTKTLLGEWAKKQISLLSAKKLSIAYPKNLRKYLFLQKKHLINIIANNFSHVKSNPNNDQVSHILHKSTLADNQHNLGYLETTTHAPLGNKITPGDVSDYKFPRSRANPENKFFHETSRMGIKLKVNINLYGWDTYSVKLKSVTGQHRFNNWKNLYSLDQLMAYQHEKTFRRKTSTYKIRLVEAQRLTSLYGKLSKVKLLKSMAAHFSGPISRKPYNLPCLLEKRLDVALKRCFMFNTLRCARHWISQGKIRLNGQIVTTPSLLLMPGDMFSIAGEHRENFKSTFLDRFYKSPKESKYIQSGKLISRWKEWALLYNLSKKRYNPHNEQKLSNFAKAKIESLAYKVNLVKSRLPYKQSTVNKYPRLVTWPDKGIKNFWYLSGRYPFKLISNIVSNNHNTNKQLFLIRWLAKQRWPRINAKFMDWKKIYRKRIALFSRWLLSQTYLTCDGLYFLRWHRAFIRKKSKRVLQQHRKLGLQKPLHFEVSYKNLCALYLYPPQKIAWPCPIDFRKI